jgi:hypothetical protein
MEDKKREEAVSKLIRVLRVSERFMRTLGALTDQYSHLKGLKEIVMREAGDNQNVLLDEAVPIYVKYLDPKVVEDMINFYESGSGKDIIDALPDIEAEMMPVGHSWGKKVMEAALEQWEEENEYTGANVAIS